MKLIQKENLKTKKKSDFVTNLPLTLLALPAIIFLFVFKYIPLYGLILPFKDYKINLGMFRSQWIGFKNFEYLIKSKDMLVAARNTILYNFVFLFVGLVVAILIALLLFEVGKNAVKTYQTMLLLPHFVSWVVVSYVVLALFDMENGAVNHILNMFGIENIMWYNDPKYWPPILIVFNIWKGMGYSAIMYYASLMGIDKELFEAAEIDGANRIKRMWYISVPMLKPIVTILMITNIGSIFYGDFGLFYNLPQNNPILYPTTDVVDTFVFRAMMQLGDMGMSSAAGMVQSVLGFLLVIITNQIVSKVDNENALF